MPNINRNPLLLFVLGIESGLVAVRAMYACNQGLTILEINWSIIITITIWFVLSILIMVSNIARYQKFTVKDKQSKVRIFSKKVRSFVRHIYKSLIQRGDRGGLNENDARAFFVEVTKALYIFS